MSTLMVALRWNGSRLSRQQLLDHATTAVQKVDVAFQHLDLLDIQAMPDEEGQFVQLVVRTSADQGEADRLTRMLKEAFAGL